MKNNLQEAWSQLTYVSVIEFPKVKHYVLRKFWETQHLELEFFLWKIASRYLSVYTWRLP